MVANDYTIRFRNRFYQLLKPVYPGERGGRVVLEQRLDGTLAIRFGTHYVKYEEIPAAAAGKGRPEPAQAPPTGQSPWRPAEDHPWRQSFQGTKGRGRA